MYCRINTLRLIFIYLFTFSDQKLSGICGLSKAFGIANGNPRQHLSIGIRGILGQGRSRADNLFFICTRAHFQ